MHPPLNQLVTGKLPARGIPATAIPGHHLVCFNQCVEGAAQQVVNFAQPQPVPLLSREHNELARLV